MLTYHSGAWVGSATYAATTARGRSMTISVMTSTAGPTRSISSPFAEQLPFLFLGLPALVHNPGVAVLA
jgi:hypothetical protein